MICNQFLFFIFCLQIFLSIHAIKLDDFCNCETVNGEEKCDCDHKAFEKALIDSYEKKEKQRLDEWEAEKDEWRQEFQVKFQFVFMKKIMIIKKKTITIDGKR